jgi:hypothetical protein
MTMNCATQHTASSHPDPEPRELWVLCAGVLSATPGLAFASTLTGALPVAIGGADGW